MALVVVLDILPFQVVEVAEEVPEACSKIHDIKLKLKHMELLLVLAVLKMQRAIIHLLIQTLLSLADWVEKLAERTPLEMVVQAGGIMDAELMAAEMVLQGREVLEGQGLVRVLAEEAAAVKLALVAMAAFRWAEVLALEKPPILSKKEQM